jgi:hypothetical protein
MTSLITIAVDDLPHQAALAEMANGDVNMQSTILQLGGTQNACKLNADDH